MTVDITLNNSSSDISHTYLSCVCIHTYANICTCNFNKTDCVITHCYSYLQLLSLISSHETYIPELPKALICRRKRRRQAMICQLLIIDTIKILIRRCTNTNFWVICTSSLFLRLNGNISSILMMTT